MSTWLFQDLPILPGGQATHNNKVAGSLPTPTFLDESHVWVDANGKLVFLLPDPNSDGLVPPSITEPVYEINLMVGCETLFTDVFSSPDYPAFFQPQWPVPTEPYFLNITRIDLASAKRPPDGQGAVIVGPLVGSGFSQLPTDAVEIKRWLLHMPKLAGGFEASLVFNNKFPDIPAAIFLVGFDENGKVISGTQKKVSVVGSRPQSKLYQDSSGKSYLYGSSMADRISHIGLIELNGNRIVDVTVNYKSTVQGALSASVPETDLERGDTVGSQFVLDARESSAFWDGVAFLNLTGKQSAAVSVSQINRETNQVIATHDLGSVDPGSKKLSVLSSLFAPVPGTYYTFSTSTPGQKIQVLGLKGTLQSNPPLMVTAPVTKKQ